MNLTDFLLMKNGNTVKPGADLFDILLAKKLGGAGVITTLVGNPLSFLAKKAQIAKSTKVTLEPVQAGSGDPSPTNICPISGRTGVEIKGCGKNLFDKSATFNEHNGYILNDSGVQVSSVASGYTDPVTEVFPNTTYILTGELTEYNESVTANGFRVYYYTANGEFIGRSANLRPSQAFPFSSFTTPSNCRMLAYQWQFTYGYPHLDTIQLELGSEATTYEPYTESNDVTITFPALGYNQWDEEWIVGVLDGNGNYTPSGNRVVSKNFIPVLSETQYYVSFVGWLYFYNKNQNKINAINVNNNYFTTPEGTAYIKFYTNAEYGNVYNHDISINYPSTFTTYEPYTNTVYGGTLDVETGILTVDRGYIASYNGEAINEPWISDRDKYVQGTTPTIGAEVVYQLATTRTIQLTPSEVQLLKGVNNLWTDGDSIELTYRA